MAFLRLSADVAGRHSREYAIAAVVFAAVLAISPTWWSLNTLWLETTAYAHGYLIAAVSLIWLMQRGAGAADVMSRPSGIATLLLSGAIATWLIAYKANNAMGQQLLAPWVIWLTIASVTGWATAWRLAAPIAYLYFAIPIWDVLAPLLQKLTIVASESLLQWLGIPSTIDGITVTIPQGQFEIEESCSGKGYFVAALALATLFVPIYGLRGVRAGGFIALAGALSILANWGRVITVIYAGYSTDMRHYLVAREHGTFGWIIFFALLTLIYWLGVRFARYDGEMAGHVPPASDRAATSFMPAALARTGAILCVPFAAALYINLTPQHVGGDGVLSLPGMIHATWQGPHPATSPWDPSFAGASAQARATYTAPSGSVDVFVAAYRRQRQGAELVSSNNRLLNENWVTARANPFVEVSQSGIDGVRIVMAEDSERAPWLISFVYRIDTITTGSPVIAQLAYGTLSWLGERPSRVVALAAKCRNSCDSARRDLADLWREIGPSLLTKEPRSIARGPQNLSAGFTIQPETH